MTRRMRQIGIMGIVALLALFALIPMAGAAPRSAETKSVSIKDFEFDPKTVSVAVGDTVMWKNAGPAPHTATANDASFDSGNLNVGAEFSFTFTKAGTFSYACKYHDIMQGTIEVKDAAAPAAAPAAQTPTGTVDVSDQPLTNSSITVANVNAGQDGWIVAHLDEGGAPGKVLGQTAIKKGDNKNVAIKLSESVPAGGKLWPMLHIDAGTIGTYEFPGADAPVIGADGKPVMKQISVTAAAAQPAQLPTTGGVENTIALLMGALALLAAGALLVARQRRA